MKRIHSRFSHADINPLGSRSLGRELLVVEASSCQQRDKQKQQRHLQLLFPSDLIMSSSFWDFSDKK